MGERGRTAREAAEWVPISGGGIAAYESDDPYEQGTAQQLMDWLTDGTLNATGYRAPITLSSKRESIPSHCWEFLIIDFAANTAGVVDGLEYHGLRVFENVAGAAPGGPLNANRPLNERAEDWADEIRRQPGRTKREVATEIAARQGVDVGTVEREARRARGNKRGKNLERGAFPRP